MLAQGRDEMVWTRFEIASFASVSRAPALAFLCACTLLAAPAAVRAEGFLDVRLGAAFSETDDLEVRSDGPVVMRGDRLEYDVAPSFGVRGGYWFTQDASWLGLGLDLSYFHALEDRSRGELDIFALPLTPLLMLRVPIGVDDRFPGGRVQPYAAVGPALTLSVARLATDDFVPGLEDFYGAEFDLGLDARGGLAVHVAPRVALFLEYRYTYLDLDYDAEVDFDFASDPDLDVETILRTHHTTLGVSFRF